MIISNELCIDWNVVFIVYNILASSLLKVDVKIIGIVVGSLIV